jgi:hypothetical protein
MLSPRRTPDQIKRYIEQRYVDSFASIHEKIAYKKNPKTWPYRAEPNERLYPYVLNCGHEPHYIAIYCHKIALKNGGLHYDYKYFQGEDENHRPMFKLLSKVINIT